ncbi:acetyltransferase [Limnobacter sp.]
MKNLIIYGAGDFAKLMAQYFTNHGKYKLVSFCVDPPYFREPIFNGHACWPTDKVKDHFSTDDTDIFVAAGYSSMHARESMFLNAERLGYSFASFYNPNVWIDASAKIGRNVVIMPGVQIEPNVVIGDNCIIWSSSVLCHDAVIGPHCFVAAQTLIGGRSRVGSRSFLGFNSSVIHDVTIGDDCLIGAKTLVTHNISSQSKCIGIPGKVVDVVGAEGVRVK